MTAKTRAYTHLAGAVGAVVVCLSLVTSVIAWGYTSPASPVTPLPRQASGLPVPRQQVSPVKPSPSAPPAPPVQPGGPGVDCSVLRCVALTFDDGPSTQWPGILAVLDQRKVKATFFVQGWRAAADPGAIAAIAAAGHVIGNHSYNHPHFKGKTVDFIDGQLQKTNDIIVAAGAPKPTLMRPPYGDNPRALSQADANLGMVGILWDVDPADWKNPGPEKIIANVLTNTQRGSIVLMHDMWPGTVDALLPIIDNLLAAGFVLVTVPELIGDQPPGTVLRNGAR